MGGISELERRRTAALSLSTMFRNRIYYRIKPLLPYGLRLTGRRWLAERKRRRSASTWPIRPGSEQPPQDWAGWPEGKQFALVLTHDVEGPDGLQKCLALMRLEQELGFRSSFNFVPEGKYRVPVELREELVRNGFEVGVHDLKHDGRLYLSRRQFQRNAACVNRYLEKWSAVGFRSAFMFHNLHWLQDLNIEYDASTFDTDPFEPQPEGRHTIFPFWVSNDRGGYVELPYTLPQDCTLFLLLCERAPTIWFKKLAWLAQHGGMVLLDTHPDYMAMNGVIQGRATYSVDYYRQFLEHIRTQYAGAYWHALPREIARFVRNIAMPPHSEAENRFTRFVSRRKLKPKIWIDLDNTPHVPFFEPIIDEFRSRGVPLLVTARDAFQVCDLADKKKLNYLKIGRHYGKNHLRKAAGLAYRALQLAPHVLRERPALGVSHGARSQLLLANWLRLPTVLIEDYEYCRFPVMMRPTWVMAPSVIPDAMLRFGEKVRKYPGIKEDVYAWKLQPDRGVLKELGLRDSDLVVTVRPPATEAHYHNPESEKLLETLMERACQIPQVRIVLLPRNHKQLEFLRTRWPQWFERGKTVVPPAALDGLNLIWHSDLIVSGGGTMNREAAALGVPVYSIFRGTIGAVDRHLTDEGRLVLIESVQDIHRQIRFEKRPQKSLSEVTSKHTLQHIVDTLQEIAEEVVR